LIIVTDTDNVEYVAIMYW